MDPTLNASLSWGAFAPRRSGNCIFCTHTNFSPALTVGLDLGDRSSSYYVLEPPILGGARLVTACEVVDGVAAVGVGSGYKRQVPQL